MSFNRQTLAAVKSACVLGRLQSVVGVERSKLGVRPPPASVHSRPRCRRSAAGNHADDEAILAAGPPSSPTHHASLSTNSLGR